MTLTHSPGDPNWIDLFTTDTDQAREFYGDLFGWTAQDSGPEYGGYIVFERNGEPIAGCMKNDGNVPSAWTVYLASDDAAKTTELAKEHDGQVVLEPMLVGDRGYMAMVIDPAGAAVGIWQPLQHRGFSARGEVGAPSWFETLTKDYEHVVPFYRDVFGWDQHTMSDTPEFRYTTLGLNEDAKAGIMDASQFLGEQPSRWQFYVEVADTDATVAQAEAKGATVVQAAETTPYGRIALLNDPEGVMFAVMSNPAS
jgi:predicted enzyme related to lactoylglutathione lyase